MITQMIVEPTHTDNIDQDLQTVRTALQIPDSAETYHTEYGDVILVNVHDSDDPEKYLTDRLDAKGFPCIVWDKAQFDAPLLGLLRDDPAPNP